MEREHRLLLLCCRLHTDDAVAVEIRSLLDGAIDWNKLIELAVVHQVAPLLHRTLDRVVADKIPPAVAHAFRFNYGGWREQTQILWRELCRVLDGLADGGVHAIPFKGPVLAQSVYGDMALRPFGDLDFLVRPDDIDRTLTLLQTLDYVLPRRRSPRQEWHFRRYAGQYRIPRRDAKVCVEPHWALSQHNFAIDLDQQALWQRARAIDVHGYRVRCFAPRDELLVLCVHGFREQWRRLKWICDIAEIVRANPAIDWDALMREARAAGCARMVILGLVLAHDLLDAPVPDRVLAHRDRRLGKLISRVCVVLFERKAEAPRLWRPNAFIFFGHERLRNRLRYVARTVFAPRPAIIEAMPVSDSLFWVYYPARWINDYVLLPPWRVLKHFGRTWRGRE